MIIKKVQIKNFFSIQDIELDLSKKSLCLIQGNNLDDTSANSNGAGKSSIVDAIFWCLTGETTKGDKADSVVNSTAKKNTCVVVYLSENNVDYRVSRYRKDKEHGNGLKLAQSSDFGASWVDTTKGTTTLSEQALEGILGASKRSLLASCYAGQDGMVDIPGLTDKGLKNLLEQSLNFLEFDLALNNVLKDINEKTLKLKDIQNKISNIKTKILTFEKSLRLIQSTEESNEEVDAEAKSKIISLEKEINKFNNLIKQINKKIEELNILMKENNKQKEINNYKLNNESLTYDCKICGLNVTKNIATDKVQIEKEILQEKMNDNLAEFFNLQLKKTKLEKALAVYSKKLSLLNEEKNKYLVNVSVKQITKKEKKETISQINNNIELETSLLDKLIKIEKLILLEIENLEKIAFFFSSKGFKFYYLENLTPFLNQKTNEYLKILSDNNITAEWSTVVRVGKEYKEKFKIEVESKHTTGYANFSGGEKRKVKLACWLALQDLIASQGCSKLSFWVADEIDDALDINGLERLMSLLQNKSKSKSTILIVSHRDLKDWIDDCITVYKKNGISYL